MQEKKIEYSCGQSVVDTQNFAELEKNIYKQQKQLYFFRCQIIWLIIHSQEKYEAQEKSY